jgi:hypothetical protein
LTEDCYWEGRTDIDASASVVGGRFDYRDFLSVRGSATSSSRPTATTSDEDDVVLVGKLDWGHLGRVERSRDLVRCVRNRLGDGEKKAKKNLGEPLERGQLTLLAREEMESQRWDVLG